MAKVVSINPQGLLYRKIKTGDEVTAFDAKPFLDILDYIYADSNDSCTLSVTDRAGNKKNIVAKKISGGDTMGLEFDESVDIVPKECRNNCIFCFVNQLPEGMRDTLYIKDDDYRLSFISGSYITCTNLEEEDIQRILDYRLSPLYVSVHTTDEELRKRMLGIKKAVNQLDIIRRLTAGGISIHAQIVLVPDVNDGENLKKTLADLYEAKVKSVAAVPVGLTCHREGKPEIRPLGKAAALQAIESIESFYNEHKYFCWASDEMYQIAAREVRNPSYYGDYPQIENGVGLIAKFLDEIKDALNYAPKKLHKHVGVVTGVSGKDTMLKVKQLLESHWKHFQMDVHPIENTFFGRSVTVTGLVTAGDIIKTLEGAPLADEIIVPSVMLKEFDTVFLDGMSIGELSKRLKRKIIVSAVTGECFLDTIIYGE
ncbi:MAG: DUF512 domain-containing protein [Clostridia bacterium]|nr:DUF512 domain-containing protein [Clostridia bacterium]